MCVIHESSIQDATQKFYSVKYTMDGGVYGYYHELQRYASRMIHEPDSYMFNTQLMMGLPSSILRSVIDKGVTTKTSALEDIFYMAKSVEEGNKVLRRYDEHQRPGVSTSSHPVHTAQSSHPNPTSIRPVQGTRSMPAPAGPSKSRVPDCRAPDRIVSCLTENDLYNHQRVTPATCSIISLALVNLAMETSRKILPAIHAVE
jgi:hypothetical protein